MLNKAAARIGFEGQHRLRFIKNLPSAFSNPDIVAANLAHAVSLGRVTSSFDNSQFPNFLVSRIGLVPKKHSENEHQCLCFKG